MPAGATADQRGPESLAAAADPTPGALQAALDADLPLQLPLLGAFLRATAQCPLGEVDVEPSCPQVKQYAEARRKIAGELSMSLKLAALGRGELRHASPTVRLLGFQLATAEWATDQPQLVQAMAAEADPKVQRAQLHFAFRAAQAQGGLAELFAWTQAQLPGWKGPERQGLRLLAVQNLAKAAATDLALDATRLASLCELAAGELETPDGVQRSAMCLAVAPACPQLASARLAEAGISAQEAEACATGLLAGWCEAPGYATANDQAYQGFVQELARAPQGNRPAFALVQRLACARPLAMPDAELSAEALAWKKRAGFAQVAALRSQLVRLVESDLASGFARAEALRTARDLGVGPAQLAIWRQRWGKAEFGVEGQLRRALAP